MARRSLENLRAIVTGASSGIGRQLTLQLAENGVHVVAVARRKDRIEELVCKTRDAPGSTRAFAGDITDPEVRKMHLSSASRNSEESIS